MCYSFSLIKLMLITGENDLQLILCTLSTVEMWFM